jgi:hypothetical protein
MSRPHCRRDDRFVQGNQRRRASGSDIAFALPSDRIKDCFTRDEIKDRRLRDNSLADITKIINMHNDINPMHQPIQYRTVLADKTHANTQT